MIGGDRAVIPGDRYPIGGETSNLGEIPNWR